MRCLESAQRLLHPTFCRVLPTLVVCVVLLEAGLRLTGHAPFNSTEGIYVGHGGGYRLGRNLNNRRETPSYSYTILTNDLGFRDKISGTRKLGSVPYIAWVGDSITFAMGVDYDQSFVGIFDAVAEGRGIESANLAVPGHRFTDEEDTLYEFLDNVAIKPSWVVVNFTAMGITTFEQPYDDIIVKDGDIFPKKGWLIPYARTSLQQKSSAYCFFRDGVRHVQARLHPEPSRSALDGVGELFTKKGPWGGRDAPARFEARLEHLDERIRQSGAVPIYVYMPSALDLRAKDFLAVPGHNATDYDFDMFLRLLQRHTERAGIRLVNLRPQVQKHQDAGERLLFTLDPHYNAAGNEVIGLALRDALLGDRGLIISEAVAARRGHS